MPEVLFNNDDVTVLGSPESIDLLLDIGPQGIRGSRFFTGSFIPTNETTIGGIAVQLGDFYLNISQATSEYSYLYEYVSQPGGNVWIARIAVSPTINNSLPGSPGIASALKMISGQYYTSPSAHSGANRTVNTTNYAPLFVPESTTFDRILCRSGSTFSGTASVRLGIYNDNGGKPGTVALDAGTVSITAANTNYTITINQTLSAGTYWLAFNMQTAATTSNFMCKSTPYFQSHYGTAPNGGFGTIGFTESGITGAFATAGTLTDTTTCAVVYLRKA